jgi:hypothetical protein
VGWLLTFLYARPKYGTVVKRHMEMLKKPPRLLAPVI